MTKVTGSTEPESKRSSPAGEKLQKVLAAAGLGSRREMERWIEAGRIRINQRPARLGDRVGSHELIQVDGRRLARSTGPVKRAPHVLVYHKPVGELCARSDNRHGRDTVFARLPPPRSGRWISVGRLDLNSSGLLLFTTDGELAHRLMHPSSEIPREYAVRVLGDVTPEMLERLTSGVALQDGAGRFESVRQGGGSGANHWYQVTLIGGRNREVRRLWESQGVKVSRLVRVRFGPVTLPRGLVAGRFEMLGGDALQALLRAAGYSAPGRRNVTDRVAKRNRRR